MRSAATSSASASRPRAEPWHGCCRSLRRRGWTPRVCPTRQGPPLCPRCLGEQGAQPNGTTRHLRVARPAAKGREESKTYAAGCARRRSTQAGAAWGTDLRRARGTDAPASRSQWPSARAKDLVQHSGLLCEGDPISHSRSSTRSGPPIPSPSCAGAAGHPVGPRLGWSRGLGPRLGRSGIDGADHRRSRAQPPNLRHAEDPCGSAGAEHVLRPQACGSPRA